MIEHIEARPLAGALGAEVHGVKLATMSDAEWTRVHELWLEHLVLFFPDQLLTPEEHVALGRRLGELETHPYLKGLDEKHPEVVVLDSETGARADLYHTDVTCEARPPMASILNMVTLPAVGGDTIWTNQYLAYDSLAPATREFIDGLTATHTAAGFGKPDVARTHPVVRIHPETGRKCLFVNRGFTGFINELGGIESDAVLGMLFDISEQPHLQVRYRWSEGAVGMWDNRCTQHYAVNDYSERRIINRVTVLGDEPSGPPARRERESDPARTITVRANKLGLS